jgi:hypothetical protein
MGSVSITKLYELLIPTLGRESAEQLTTYLEEKIMNGFNDRSLVLATKVDIAVTKAEIINTKAEIIKWMFVFWIGQVAATFGFILLYLKK